MSLIESVLSSIVIAFFLSVFVGAIFSFVSLKEKCDYMNKSYNQDYFLAKSFEKLESNEKIEEWKSMCASLYPDVDIQVHKIGTKDTTSLYVSEWNGKKSYLKCND